MGSNPAERATESNTYATPKGVAFVFLGQISRFPPTFPPTAAHVKKASRGSAPNGAQGGARGRAGLSGAAGVKKPAAGASAAVHRLD